MHAPKGDSWGKDEKVELKGRVIDGSIWHTHLVRNVRVYACGGGRQLVIDG